MTHDLIKTGLQHEHYLEDLWRIFLKDHLYLFSKSNNYCFIRATQRQLSKCNPKSTATALRRFKKNKIIRRKVFYKKDVLKNFSKCTGKNLRWSYLLDKLKPATNQKITITYELITWCDESCDVLVFCRSLVSGWLSFK